MIRGKFQVALVIIAPIRDLRANEAVQDVSPFIYSYRELLIATSVFFDSLSLSLLSLIARMSALLTHSSKTATRGIVHGNAAGNIRFSLVQ